MWLIVGTAPDERLGLSEGPYTVEGNLVKTTDGREIPVERGTAALAAAAAAICAALKRPLPRLLIAGDNGKGAGSRAAYKYLIDNMAALKPEGITFHYLFPDVDWHNRILMAAEALEPKPLLVADAGFMYAAKMSGYAASYDLFTPDAGELAFLADEKAPHPIYTRGFLLDTGNDFRELLRRANENGNCARYAILKGSVDHVARGDEILAEIVEPSVKYMEAIGGTGDLVTGFATGLLASGVPMEEACINAARACRNLAALAKPNPATQVAELLNHNPLDFLPI